MTSLRRPKGIIIAFRRAMEKMIYDSYSDLFGCHVYMPTYHLRQDGYIVPSNHLKTASLYRKGDPDDIGRRYHLAEVFSAALENIMRHTEWKGMRVKVGSPFSHPSNIEQAEKCWPNSTTLGKDQITAGPTKDDVPCETGRYMMLLPEHP
ncbi:unnamed protein product [Haemonchus placei]|uniref:PEPCK_N domain-containing protein n=1 Tax=Haemonchus placei TaxID=6290 RepID=A0A0N4WE95_HAEPC|nr:unnamed protein product [Haemonchus placei]